MVAFEVSIAIFNRLADWHLVLFNNCGYWRRSRNPAEWTAQVLAFLRGYSEGDDGGNLRRLTQP